MGEKGNKKRIDNMKRKILLTSEKSLDGFSMTMVVDKRL